MNHTPGPWKFVKHSNYSHYFGRVKTLQEGRNYPGVALVEHNGRTISKEEVEANANLIAAAPELLEALEEMYEKCNISPDDAPHRVKARAAIAKAKGNSK